METQLCEEKAMSPGGIMEGTKSLPRILITTANGCRKEKGQGNLPSQKKNKK